MGPSTHLHNFNTELLLSKGNTGTKSRAESEGKTAPPGDSSHMQTPNPDTVANAKKHMLTRV